MMEYMNLFDFEAASKKILSKATFGYFASGAMDQVTLDENRKAFDRLRLWYRVLVDVQSRDLSTPILGQDLGFPLLVAPMAFQRLAHPDGELATARAASKCGAGMVLSTLSHWPVEQVAATCESPLWFQLYVYKDRGITEALLRRVENAGCRAVVVTVDAPFLGRREADIRNQFQLPSHLTIANALPKEGGPRSEPGPDLTNFFTSLIDPSLSWVDLEWLRKTTKLPILLKGIIRPDDALKAFEHGVSGIVVSNHGGRQLDTSPATIDALPAISKALAKAGVPEDFALLLDGGIRRGTDIVKALALGAKAVLLGRPALWGLAVDGEDGVAKVISLLKQEFDLAMALCGCDRVSHVKPDLVR